MKNTNQLEPISIWTYFNQICQIPRASKKEDKIRNFLIAFASEHNLKYKTDDAKNLLIIKDASAKYIDKPSIALQTHMDMVCEKDSNSNHNFDTDAIQTYIDGDWVKATDTTLGADNGIGVAMQMALLASDIELPKLECLFTVDEETGLYGANNLDPNLLKSNTLINLDSEEEGEFCIGCAGGMDTLVHIDYTPETEEKLFYFHVKVSGLQGGHSGEDINKNRGNAIKILARYLQNLKERCEVRICSISGGNLRNAIPREAEAILAVPVKYKEPVRVEINIFIDEIETEMLEFEPKVNLELGSISEKPLHIPFELGNKLIDALNNCQNGVISMDKNIDGLVETSTNLAAIHIVENSIFIETSQRSSKEEKKKEVAKGITKNFSGIASKIEKGKDYPGWEPNMNSEILEKCKTSYTKLFNQTPIIKVIHAGLECGVIGKKYPNMDMISFGPTIENPHSPFEKVSISTVEKTWNFLIEVLQSV